MNAFTSLLPSGSSLSPMEKCSRIYSALIAYVFLPALSQRSLGSAHWCSVMRLLALVSARAEPTISSCRIEKCRSLVQLPKMAICVVQPFHITFIGDTTAALMEVSDWQT